MKFAFVAKHRGIWPVRWMCEALGISRSGFHAWLARPPSKRARTDDEVGARVRASFLASDRTYGARRVWRDVLGDGIACGLHKIERLMRAQALRARPRRRGLPKDEGDRLAAALSPNLGTVGMTLGTGSRQTGKDKLSQHSPAAFSKNDSACLSIAVHPNSSPQRRDKLTGAGSPRVESCRPARHPSEEKIKALREELRHQTVVLIPDIGA